MLVLATFLAVLGCITSSAAVSFVLAALSSLTMSYLVCDMVAHLSHVPDDPLAGDLVRKFVASLYATLVVVASEVGRFVGLLRHGLSKCVFHRFDRFVGSHPDAILHQRVRARTRVVVAMAMLAAWMARI